MVVSGGGSDVSDVGLLREGTVHLAELQRTSGEVGGFEQRFFDVGGVQVCDRLGLLDARETWIIAELDLDRRPTVINEVGVPEAHIDGMPVRNVERQRHIRCSNERGGADHRAALRAGLHRFVGDELPTAFLDFGRESRLRLAAAQVSEIPRAGCLFRDRSYWAEKNETESQDRRAK